MLSSAIKAGTHYNPAFVRATYACTMRWNHNKSHVSHQTIFQASSSLKQHCLKPDNADKDEKISKDTPQGSKVIDTAKATRHMDEMTVTERDAALMLAWKERGGGMATAEFEDGKLEEGYRRNVVGFACPGYTSEETNSLPYPDVIIRKQTYFVTSELSL